MVQPFRGLNSKSERWRYAVKTSLLAPVSQKVIRDVAQVSPGENVLILTDPLVSGKICISLSEAVHLQGGSPSILVMPPSRHPGAPLPSPAEQAVKGAEVVIMATSKSVAHAEIFSREKNHRRLISMPGIMEESFIEGGGTMDLEELRKITERVSRTLEGKRHFILTSDKGTDAIFASRGRAFSCFSRPPVPAGFTMFPDGESIVALQEKTLEGRIVLDVFQTGVGPLREPITFDLEEGRVVKITGGIEAQLLLELLEKYGDENAYYFGEFALGTNPKARFIGSAGEDKKRIGTIHMSLGDDIDIGGELKSRLHLDGVMGRPTLMADGQTLIEDGQLRI
jgi:leucyl aminopeptidase (aminopeptidase T)